jgi:acetate kinase
MDREGLSTDQIRKILNSQSGLLGLSGVSGDMRDLQEAAEKGNDRARLAIEAYCYSVRREIGAMATAIGGMDVLAFAGGIGERSPAVRSLICRELEHLGVILDENRNAGGHLEREISSDESTTRAYIVATDEEAIVERAVAEYLETSP